MGMMLIDRRKAGRGKSSNNRQKLLKRVRSFIKTAVPQNIGQGGVVGGNAKPTSPVKVAGEALEEPFFAYARDGEHTAVLIGNSEYERGDEIELPEDGEGDGHGNKAGQGDSGEDDFIVNVARDEFLDVFFEDCELPNLTNERFTERLDNTFQHAGFSTTGSPAQLSIVRTYKQMVGRRRALTAPHSQELAELEKELEQIYTIDPEDGDCFDDEETARIDWLEQRIDELRKKIAVLRGFDKSDMRFRKKEAKPLKTVDAVLIMIMDISGSMDEQKKTISRRWFALLYAFIKRRYKATDLVFIAHHDEAMEMSEDDFFSTRINGGTSVSPALKLTKKIIKERFDPNQTNIYVCHASDGDNWDTDNELVQEQLIGEPNLLGAIQFFSYVEVGSPRQRWFNLGASTAREDSNLWQTYDKVREKVSKDKMNLVIIESADDCYPVFKKVFRKHK